MAFPAWLTRSEATNTNTLRRLTSEIESFVAYVELKPEDIRARQAATAAVKHAAAECWPSVRPRVEAFGSFASNLSSFASDIDLCIYGGCGARPVQRFDQFLAGQSWPVEVQAIAEAKTPIVTITHFNGVSVDASFSCQGTCGLEQTAFLQAVQAECPTFRAVVCVIKFLLQQRDLHKAFTG